MHASKGCPSSHNSSLAISIVYSSRTPKSDQARPSKLTCSCDSGRGEQHQELRMIELRSKRLFKRSSKANRGGRAIEGHGGGKSDIQWEVRPGGMLVQKRECGEGGDEVITVRISTGFNSHYISIGATATFWEMKMAASMLTGLEPKEQRLLFKGKEREDDEHLHMVGVRDKDKVLLLEDPAIKEMKLRAMAGKQVMSSPCRTIIRV